MKKIIILFLLILIFSFIIINLLISDGTVILKQLANIVLIPPLYLTYLIGMIDNIHDLNINILILINFIFYFIFIILIFLVLKIISYYKKIYKNK